MKDKNLVSRLDDLRSLLSEITPDMKFNMLFIKLYEVVNLFIKSTIDSQSIAFPIPIRHLVRIQNIDIVETDLNPSGGFNVNYTKGRLSRLGYTQDPQKAWIIYIDKYQSDDSKRYMLAHELSHYLFRCYGNAQEKGATLNNCVDPLFPKKFEEQCADIMASFFLFPIPEVVDEFDNYVNCLNTLECERMDSYEWLQRLSCAAGVPFHYTATCYQQIRNTMNFYYLIMNESKNKRKNEICFGNNSFYNSFEKKFKDKYEKFFK